MRVTDAPLVAHAGTVGEPAQTQACPLRVRSERFPAHQRAELLGLVRAVQMETGVGPRLLLSSNRISTVSHARQRLMVLLRRAHWSLADIGRALGRDHSTVIYGIRAAQRRERDVTKALGPPLPFRRSQRDGSS